MTPKEDADRVAERRKKNGVWPSRPDAELEFTGDVDDTPMINSKRADTTNSSSNELGIRKDCYGKACCAIAGIPKTLRLCD